MKVSRIWFFAYSFPCSHTLPSTRGRRVRPGPTRVRVVSLFEISIFPGSRPGPKTFYSLDPGPDLI